MSAVLFSSFSLQSELVDLAESIEQKLSYFNELENINTVGFFFFVFRLMAESKLSRLSECSLRIKY